MKIPAITGTIRRRILLNYRVAPAVARAVLPARFRPKLVGNHAIAGICLIRLEGIRPKGFPKFTGISSENSAHRIAVEWEDGDGETQQGVFVPRRDTNSCMNALAGGRVFPGVHHHSEFTVEDREGQISMRIVSDDIEQPLVELEATETEVFSAESIFPTLRHSSEFFEAGCIGYSTPVHPQVDGEFGWQPGARLCAKHQPQQVWRDSESEMLLRLAFSTVALHRQLADAPFDSA